MTVHDVQALGLQRPQHRQLHHVHADRLTGQPVIAQDAGQPAGVAALDPDLLRDGPAPAGDARPPVRLVVPGREHLMGAGRRPDVPQDRVGAAHHQAAAEQLVPGPVADVRRGRVADVVHVEQDQGADVGLFECGADLVRTVGPEPGEIDALFPVGAEGGAGGGDGDGCRGGGVVLDHGGGSFLADVVGAGRGGRPSAPLRSLDAPGHPPRPAPVPAGVVASASRAVQPPQTSPCRPHPAGPRARRDPAPAGPRPRTARAAHSLPEGGRAVHTGAYSPSSAGRGWERGGVPG